MRDITEGQLTRQIKDYLQFERNLKHLWFSRLNSGDFFLPAGSGKFYRVTGCGKGTADFIVIKDGRTIFIELKSAKGKQSPDQRNFEIEIQEQGARYFVVREFEELQKILEVVL